MFCHVRFFVLVVQHYVCLSYCLSVWSCPSCHPVISNKPVGNHLIDRQITFPVASCILSLLFGSCKDKLLLPRIHVVQIHHHKWMCCLAPFDLLRTSNPLLWVIQPLLSPCFFSSFSLWANPISLQVPPLLIPKSCCRKWGSSQLAWPDWLSVSPSAVLIGGLLAVVFADFLVIGKEQEATDFRLDCVIEPHCNYMSWSYIHIQCCTYSHYVFGVFYTETCSLYRLWHCNRICYSLRQCYF